MSVTDELNELIAEHNGNARDALNVTLAHPDAANGEIRVLKSQLAKADENAGADTQDYIALKSERDTLAAELAALRERERVYRQALVDIAASLTAGTSEDEPEYHIHPAQHVIDAALEQTATTRNNV